MKSIGILKWVFTLVGGAMLAGALLLAQHMRGFVARAQHAPGEVTQLIPRTSTDSSNSGSSITYAPRVGYSLPDGRRIEFVASTSSNPPAYRVGEHVDVLYAPDQPEQARLNGFFSLWGGPLILGILGAVFLAIGLGIQFAGRFARRKEQDLLLNGTPVMADFASVDQNTQLTVNGRHPFRVIAQWRNPATGKVHVFHSNNLWYDPQPYIDRKQLTVYLDTGNPKRYHMDVSFLPELAG